MSSIDALLNHEAAAGARRGSASQSQPEDHHQQQPTPPTADSAEAAYVAHTTYEAADALTTLATLGSGQQYAPSPSATRELPPPTAHHPPKPPSQRSASFSSTSRPAVVEPDLPADQPQSHSPTLEHYHHESKSPEEQRRQSISLAAARTSPAPVLAPIQNVSPTQTHDAQPSPRSEQIPQPHAAKHESTPTQPPTERQASVTAESIDADTRKAIELAKQDLGLRVKRNASVVESITSPTEPKPAPSKKRPAPGSTSTIKKKGTATAKKPSKKRKIDTDDNASARSVTPTSRSTKNPPSKASRNRSQGGTPAAGSSPAPDHSSQVHPSDDENDSSEDSTLYCICKKPDNHRWMIGCDGGCDDWFHGSCVNMQQADEDLVDKFICPLCEEKGRGQTTYKPMCRRDGCRKPARLVKGKESKYCSDECGATFFTEQLQRTAGAKAKPKKSKKKNNSKLGEDAGSDDDDEPTPLGGVLRAKDLKALLEPCKEIQAFKALGSGVLSPPQTAPPSQTAFDNSLHEDLSLTAGETERLKALYNEKSQLQDRLELLRDREKFVSMVKEQAVRVADREKMKAKDFCGYDSRLAWSDAEFLHWRSTKEGRASFKFSTLSPSEKQIASFTSTDSTGKDVDMPDSNNDAENEESTELDTDHICMKKRCQKHPQWQKLNLQDARFEELEIAQSIKECEKDERSVKERARRRGAKDQMAKELTAGKTNGDVNGDGVPAAPAEPRNREGWVEMVQVQVQ